VWDKDLFMTREQIRSYDRIAMESFGLSGPILMENAGQGAARSILATFPTEKKVVVIAGPGNNGGDGFVVARHLINAGRAVSVFLLESEGKTGGDARINLEIIKKMKVPVHSIDECALGEFARSLHEADLVVDALLGTGISRNVDGKAEEVITRINASGQKVVSLDIPSGLDADCGRPQGCAVKADMTVTFGHLKRGLILYPGAELCGNIEVVPIGAPGEVSFEAGYDGRMISKEMLLPLLPVRKADGHKGTFGHLLAVGGFVGKTGAASLMGQAALRTGCGLVTIATSSEARPIVEAKNVEVMVDSIVDTEDSLNEDNISKKLDILLHGKRAVALGPGLGTGPAAFGLTRLLLKRLSQPAVVDADGITLLSLDPSILEGVKSPLVMTPHPGEMAKFVQKTVQAVQDDRIGVSRETAAKSGAVMVLKGAHTVVAAPDGRVFVNPTGNPGMGTAGMGDVLTGIIGGFLAQGTAPLEAALIGVYLHGAAGDSAAMRVGPAGLLASDLFSDIPSILRQWSEENLGSLSRNRTQD
jgi:NAD(P)H-hydrate epimerase